MKKLKDFINEGRINEALRLEYVEGSYDQEDGYDAIGGTLSKKLMQEIADELDAKGVPMKRDSSGNFQSTSDHGISIEKHGVSFESSARSKVEAALGQLGLI